VKLGHVALDGTKIKANASKHKAMSYGRREDRATELEAAVAGWLRAAEPFRAPECAGQVLLTQYRQAARRPCGATPAPPRPCRLRRRFHLCHQSRRQHRRGAPQQ
jgi:hypothetical protein